MGYVLPTFNLPVSIWHPPAVPPAAASVATIGNLTPGRRTNTPAYPHPAGTVDEANMHLLLPAGVDVRDGKAASGEDLAEVPTGSGRFYRCVFVDDIAMGFANEHRFAMLRGLAPWPVPFPAGGAPIVLPGGSTCTLAAPISLGVLYRTTIPAFLQQWYLVNQPSPPLIGSQYTLTYSSAVLTGAQVSQGTCPSGNAIINLFWPILTGSGATGVGFANQLFVVMDNVGAAVPNDFDFRLTQP